MSERRQLGQGTSYAPGVVLPEGRLVAISGTVAVDPSGEVVGTSVGPQATFIFGQIDRLLGQAGGSLSDVVKITTFLTDMSGYPEYAAARAAAFADRPKPASSTVGVAALVDPRFLIEIEALAVIQ